MSNSTEREDSDRRTLLDFALDRGYDIRQYQMLRHLDRGQLKDGLQDLIKLRDFLDKYISESSFLDPDEDRAPNNNNMVGHLSKAESKALVDRLQKLPPSGVHSTVGHATQDEFDAMFGK